MGIGQYFYLQNRTVLQIALFYDLSVMNDRENRGRDCIGNRCFFFFYENSCGISYIFFLTGYKKKAGYREEWEYSAAE